MRISRGEILGLLIGLATCFGIVAYALTNNAPPYRETAAISSEQTEAESQQDDQPSAGHKRTLSVRVTGFVGEPFSGEFSTLDLTRPVAGATPTDYRLETRDDPSMADFAFVTIAKTSNNDHELRVQILDDGKAVKEGSTTKPYGVVSLTWSPDEQKPSGVTSG